MDGPDVEQMRRHFDNLAVVQDLPMVDRTVGIQCCYCFGFLMKSKGMNVGITENEKRVN